AIERWIQRRAERGGGVRGLEEDRDVVVALVRDREVRGMVAVEIRDADAAREGPGAEIGARESSGAVADQQRDERSIVGGRGHVGNAVAIEIADRDAHRLIGGGEVTPRAESAAAVPGEHREEALIVVTDHEIELAIAVDIR